MEQTSFRCNILVQIISSLYKRHGHKLTKMLILHIMSGSNELNNVHITAVSHLLLMAGVHGRGCPIWARPVHGHGAAARGLVHLAMGDQA